MIDDLPTIRRNYLRGFFFLDFIGIFPWHFVDCFVISEQISGWIKIIRLMRLLKLIRLYRIRRMIEVLHIKFPRSKYLLTCFELWLFLNLVAHWMCCAWFAVGYPDGSVTID